MGSNPILSAILLRVEALRRICDASMRTRVLLEASAKKG